MQNDKNEQALKPKKKYWHLYSLQTLQPEKLVKTVNKVLNRELALIK